jgi:hypothetical protein
MINYRIYLFATYSFISYNNWVYILQTVQIQIIYYASACILIFQAIGSDRI